MEPPDSATVGERLFFENLELRPAEFELLADGRDRVVTRPEIYQRVWHRQMTYRDRSVDVFVRKLRSKLRRAAPGWIYIHTHFGVGYRFSPERVTRPHEARN